LNDTNIRNPGYQQHNYLGRKNEQQAEKDFTFSFTALCILILDLYYGKFPVTINSALAAISFDITHITGDAIVFQCKLCNSYNFDECSDDFQSGN
jgi:hypothetical protein